MILREQGVSTISLRHYPSLEGEGNVMMQLCWVGSTESSLLH